MADESSSLFPSGNRIGSANLPLGAQLYDNAGTPKLVLDANARKIYSSDGTTVAIDWNDPTVISLLGYTVSSNGVFSGSTQGLASFDASHHLGWEAGSLGAFNPAGDDQISSNDGETYFDNSGFVGVITDGSLLSVNNSTRQLIANDGSTVALDWSDPVAIKLFADLEIHADGSVVGLSFPLKGNLLDNSSVVIVDPNNLRLNTADGSQVAGLGIFHAGALESPDGNTYFNNSGFHGIGSVIAGTKTATGTATTTFTVTIGVTMANTTYKAVADGNNALSAAVHYTTNKTTTTFDVVYLAALTGAVSFDWIVTP